jgi:hypothetical protein
MEKSEPMNSTFSQIPNVRKKVQEILRALMDSVLNFVKPDGRNVSDTIADCAWNDSDTESEVSGACSNSSTRTYASSLPWLIGILNFCLDAVMASQAKIAELKSKQKKIQKKYFSFLKKISFFSIIFIFILIIIPS